MRMPADCLFCRIVNGDESGHVVLETEHVMAFFDVRPVFKGHTLVVPRRHVVTLADLPDELLAPFFGSVRLLSQAVVHAYGCQGSFVAANNVVSQSVAHLHVHVVPRTKGDGLRGFFWPRTRYADEAEAAQYRDKLTAAVEELSSP
jgi:histidine triad (HIT) family protein